MYKSFYSILILMWYLLMANTTFAYTHADTLRGSNGPGRNWWDVQHYGLNVVFNMAGKSIFGSVDIHFEVTGTAHDSMQIDLQQPMILDSVKLEGKLLEAVNDSNVWWLKHPFHELPKGTNKKLQIYYHGSPVTAKRPPWDGGFIWGKDSTGKPWVAVACQGLGASAWWPCKDAQWDEPEQGADINIFAPNGLEVVSNGRQYFETGSDRFYQVAPSTDSAKTHIISEGHGSHWKVQNPINNYDITFYIGDYVHWHDTLVGEKGVLDLDYYVLRYNQEKAAQQFEVVKPMLHCFEHWMGPYPFYEDGYKLVEAPYLGMEHQSAIAYGNEYKMGYKGRDLSNTGVGLLFDFIIVHESGHEWFGNSITAADIADNWIHEGITTYSETLFSECAFGKDKGYEYIRGQMKEEDNDRPVIGDYGVNHEGSGDMYNKGAALIHTIRVLMNDDEKFRQMLRGMNKEFYHSTVTTKQVEDYINKFSGMDLSPLFNQYLRTADIPMLEYYIKGTKLYYHFANVVPGFTLPMMISSGEYAQKIAPSADWKHVSWDQGYNITFPKDFLITVKQ